MMMIMKVCGQLPPTAFFSESWASQIVPMSLTMALLSLEGLDLRWGENDDDNESYDEGDDGWPNVTENVLDELRRLESLGWMVTMMSTPPPPTPQYHRMITAEKWWWQRWLLFCQETVQMLIIVFSQRPNVDSCFVSVNKYWFLSLSQWTHVDKCFLRYLSVAKCDLLTDSGVKLFSFSLYCDFAWSSS